MKFKLITIAAFMAMAATVMTGCNNDNNNGTPDTETQDTEKLYINEVMAAPSGDDMDFIEIYNGGDVEINLEGFILQDNKGEAEEFVIPEGFSIPAKGILVFSQVSPGDGPSFNFGLKSEGDSVILLDDARETVDEIDTPEFDGKGQSYARIGDGGAEWKIGAPTKGTPNVAAPTGSIESVRLNEVKAVKTDGDEFDFIELYNTSDQPVDLSGSRLFDSKPEEAWTIPAGTIIDAKNFVVFTEETDFSWGLGAGGDETVTLADADDNQIDHIVLPDFQDNEISFGRSSDGDGDWTVFAVPTKGMSNETDPSAILVGKIMLNEVYTFSDQSSIDDLDWIELYNTTDTAIEVGGLKLWEGGGSEEAWTIPAGQTIPANGYLLIESDKEGLHGDPVNYPEWGLSKGGDEVVLAYGNMAVIDRVEVPSLNDQESYGRITDGDSEWQVFAQHTKNAKNEGDARGFINTVGLYVNEVYHDNTDETVEGTTFDTSIDFIELYNSTDTDMDISGWEIYDDKMEEAYIIPEGTTVAAKSFLTYDVFDENPNGPSLGLGVGGDWVFIFKPGKSEEVDRFEAPGFDKESGLRDKGYTTGRLTDGADEVVIFSQASKNASNNGKAVAE